MNGAPQHSVADGEEKILFQRLALSNVFSKFAGLDESDAPMCSVEPDRSEDSTPVRFRHPTDDKSPTLHPFIGLFARHRIGSDSHDVTEGGAPPA